MLPNDFAPWQTVYYHFRQWRDSGLPRGRLRDALRRSARVKAGRKPSPSAAVIDAQSVETTHVGGPSRGYDGGKQVKGRKRVIVDTMGLLLAVVVHAANKHESQTAPHVLRRLLGKAGRLEVVFADSGYEGTPGGLVWRCFGWLLKIVRREEGVSGFEPLEKRWVIERTFGWFEHWRRLSKDYEYRPDTSEAMIGLAMSRLMINRLR